MRSGNGRHRRPRQAPALFVAAGVTGAGIAMPLLGATGAQAADGATWDRVAECESGGLWSANADNGYYGGLQLTIQTWEEYGGTEFAARPDLASRGQQIEVAERILADQGPEAWPSCGLTGGLLLDELGSDLESPGEEAAGEAAPQDTGSAAPEDTGAGDGATSSSGEQGAEEPDAAPAERPSGQPSHSSESSESSSPRASRDAGSPSGESAGPTAGERVPEGTGRHRGKPAEEQDRTADAERPSRGGETAADTRERDGDYRVQRGDSLSAIAAEHEVEGGWPALYEQNREVVGADPDLILPGQRLDW
ncbi:transglycosylase family protein [Streptomyces sp. JJ36]|uniref:LysM peptidoglycan-binding domain-containing protein n=1 Tax=Streptomyces sp. JJ36 TaxID=2736645 RepID=UPI001F46D669|nr:transglycosylase family protein [Streptomyces sp. JJ36]MCF6526124.1 transglycosylase family protein [Streptomyces sp. JJ36]